MKRSTFYLLNTIGFTVLGLLTQKFYFGYSAAFFLGTFCEIYFH